MRHHEVEQHEADALRVAIEHVDRLLSVIHQGYAEGPLLELHLDDSANMRFVVCHEHMPQFGTVRRLHQTRDAICSRCLRSSNSSGPMCEPGFVSTRSSASVESTETIASVPLNSRRAVVRPPPRDAAPSSSAAETIDGT